MNLHYWEPSKLSEEDFRHFHYMNSHCVLSLCQLSRELIYPNKKEASFCFCLQEDKLPSLTMKKCGPLKVIKFETFLLRTKKLHLIPGSFYRFPLFQNLNSLWQKGKKEWKSKVIQGSIMFWKLYDFLFHLQPFQKSFVYTSKIQADIFNSGNFFSIPQGETTKLAHPNTI